MSAWNDCYNNDWCAAHFDRDLHNDRIDLGATKLILAMGQFFSGDTLEREKLEFEKKRHEENLALEKYRLEVQEKLEKERRQHELELSKPLEKYRLELQEKLAKERRQHELELSKPEKAYYGKWRVLRCVSVYYNWYALMIQRIHSTGFGLGTFSGSRLLSNSWLSLAGRLLSSLEATPPSREHSIPLNTMPLQLRLPGLCTNSAWG
jgi:hypothetical protein